MEDLNVKSSKSTITRGALAVIAAGAALGLTACSAGQITQTSSQVAATDGVSETQGFVALRDVTVIIGNNGDAELKFTASNAENHGKDLKLDSITVDGQNINPTTSTKTIKPGCNMVVAPKESLADIKKGLKNDKCTVTGSASLSGVKDLYIGGQKVVNFKFDDSTEFEMNAPVSAYTPEAGTMHRNDKGIPSDK